MLTENERNIRGALTEIQETLSHLQSLNEKHMSVSELYGTFLCSVVLFGECMAFLFAVKYCLKRIIIGRRTGIA